MRTEKIQTASLVYELKGEFADWMFNSERRVLEMDSPFCISV